MITSVVMTQVG